MPGPSSILPFRKAPEDRFTALVRPHLDAMYRAAWRWTQHREEAEDLVQDVLIKAVGRVDEMERLDRLRPWLVKILYRRFVDLYRRQRRTPIDQEAGWQADGMLFDELLERVGDDTDAIARVEQQRALVRGLEQLNDAQRDTVLLHDVEGYAALEVAEILEVSVGTVKSRLHRARGRLREFLDAGEPFDAAKRVDR